jgi:hypothetical protein
MKLAKYDMTVKYKPGKTLIVADHLSRSPSKEQLENMEVHMVLSANSDQLQKIAKETQKDPTLTTVTNYILRGWPDKVTAVACHAKPFYLYGDKLSVYQGIVFKCDKIVVPEILRPSFLEELHYAHLGITLTQNRAKEYLFWPGMHSDIEAVVRNCRICQEMQNNNPKEPLASTPIPDRPWSLLAADLFELDGEHYLVIVDHYSGFIEVEWMRRNTTAYSVIQRFKSQF